MDRTPFDIPVNVIVDPDSGYAINMPLGPQDYPGWQKDKPEVVERLLELRKTWQIRVPDDEFVDRLKLRETVAGKDRRRSHKPKRRQ